MRKISIIFIILIAFMASCTKNFEEFNENEINPAEVPGEALFTNAQIEIADQIASANVNLNIWKLWAQYWTETTYTDEANYDIINRTIADLAFRTWYRDILRDLKVAGELVAEQEIVLPEDEIIKQNKLAIIEMLEIYSYKRLVDIFGAVPYEQALDIDNISPAYESGDQIYNKLIDRLKTNVIAKLNTAEGSFGDADLYYGGDVSNWLKFANGLLLDFGVMLSDVNSSLAQTTIQAAFDSQNLLASNDDNAAMDYLTSSPYTNPIHEDLVLSGRKDFVIANTLVDIMDSLNDPRMDAYFDYKVDTGDGNPIYLGADYGYNSPYDSYSHVDAAILEPGYPSVLFSYVKQQFYLAEAAARGLVGSAADAEEWYYGAIRASFDYWGVSQAEADDYIAQPEVQWDEANKMNLIAVQSWIAYYINGFDGYTTYRRLDYPKMNLPPNEDFECIDENLPVPLRFTFPVNEQTLNAANYSAAVGLIGGTDDLCTPIFWDVN